MQDKPTLPKPRKPPKPDFSCNNLIREQLKDIELPGVGFCHPGALEYILKERPYLAVLFHNLIAEIDYLRDEAGAG